MSIQACPMDDYGMIFDEETLQQITTALNLEDIYETAEKLNLIQGSDFTGMARKIKDSGEGDRKDDILYDCEYLIYAPLNNRATLFLPAYGNMNEIVVEMIERFGEYLPDDYDYCKNIRHIVGIYYY